MKLPFVLGIALLIPFSVAQAQDEPLDNQPHIQPKNQPKEKPKKEPKQEPQQQEEQPRDSSSKDSQISIEGPSKSSGSNDVQEMTLYDPHKAAKDVEVGQYYLKRKNYRAALDRFNEALLYKPRDAEATFYLAETQDRLALYDQAYRNYSAYLKMLPDGPLSKQAREAVARIAPHVQQKETAATEDQAKEMIQEGEDYLTKNDFEAAHTSFVQALQIAPDDPVANFRLAESLQGLQRLDEARIFYKKYLSLDPNGKLVAEAKRQITQINDTLGK